MHGIEEYMKTPWKYVQTALFIAAIFFSLCVDAGAAISATDLTEGGAASPNITSATTNVITPGANQLILAWVVSHDNNNPIVPTLSGNGLTWTSVTAVSWNLSGGSNHDAMTLFRAMGASPTPGSVTISFAKAQQSISWSIVEFSGVNTSGTDGSGAIAQFLSGSNDAAGPSGLTITLQNPIGSGNATAGGFGNVNALSASISPGAGYTAFQEVYVTSTLSDLRAEWRPDGQVVVLATQSGSFPMGGIAVEIKAAPSGASIVKQVWTVAGTCLTSSPADPNCNAGATSATVASGTTLKFLIFVRNTTALALSDVRIQDVIDITATGFTYAAGSMKDETAQPDTATIASIFTAADTGTVLTDAVDSDVASVTGGSTMTIGAVTGQANATLNIAANTTFGLLFQATKK
jgi:hypothetical protein